jgi:hypothetical protein
LKSNLLRSGFAFGLVGILFSVSGL